MIHAYAETYLYDAMSNLGEALDYAQTCCNITADDFMKKFISSGYAEMFGKGTPKIVSGISGTELVIDVLTETGNKMDFPPAQIEYDYSATYWSGWILAYYQWDTGMPFEYIMQNITMKKIIEMYPALHESPEDKFTDIVNTIIKNKNPSARLQKMRKNRGLSQKELSEKSGVSLRSIQQYEQKSKNINKSAVTTVIALSKALYCKVEDLIEYI